MPLPSRPAKWQEEDYVYTPLEGPRHIRVLELLPSREPTAVVCCKLHHIDLDSPRLQYTAISYAWGPKDAPKVAIECDGYRAQIPRTLHSALQRLRNTTGSTQFLWADALCINQSGTVEGDIEKSGQVQMMHRIFAKAEEVVVDLGELRGGDVEALETINQYQSITEDNWSALVYASDLAELVDRLDKMDLPSKHSSFWSKFSAIASRPWYTRIWICQEFVLARKVRFMIGQCFREETFVQHGLMRAFQHLSCLYMIDRTVNPQTGTQPQLEQCLSDVYESASALLQILDIRKRDPTVNTGTFCEQLFATGTLFKATDPRDKAYALLGISSDENLEKGLVVDYNEKLADFALRVSMYLIRAGFAIFPLYHCVGDRDGYVSWALDLEKTSRDGLTQLMHASGYTRPRVFQACGKQGRFVYRFSPVISQGLQTRGYIVDSIRSVMSTHMITRAELKGPSHLRQQSPWLDRAFEWMHATAAAEGLSEEEAFVEQCWRTLIADLITGHGQEGRGLVRLRDWPHSARCITTFSARHRAHFRIKQRNSFSPGVASKTIQDPASEIAEELPELSPEAISDIRVFGDSLRFTMGRKLGLTTGRRKMGMRSSCLLPRNAQVGDLVAVIQGCHIPFILRRNADATGAEYFRIVGCGYVSDMMDGEALDEPGVEVRDIDLL